MANTYCLLNHSLTSKQTDELSIKFFSEKIIYPSDEIKQLWSNIPPEPNDTSNLLEILINWLRKAEKGDLFLVQGEFGFTFTLVDYALKAGLIPIYATTRRIATEECNGEIVSRHYIFEHVCFKKYNYYMSS